MDVTKQTVSQSDWYSSLDCEDDCRWGHRNVSDYTTNSLSQDYTNLDSHI